MLSLLACAAAVGHLQAPPPPANSPTETFSTPGGLTVDISYSWVAGQDAPFEPVDCVRTCNGAKHLVHSECDSSCDQRCPGNHRLSLEAVVHEAFATDPDVAKGEGELIKAMEKLGDRSYTGIGVDLSGMSNKKAEEAAKNPRYKFRKKVDCWNFNPCTLSYRSVLATPYTLNIGWSVYRFDTAPDGRRIRVQGPTGSLPTARLIVPKDAVDEPVNRVRCACAVVQEEGHSSLLQPLPDHEKGAFVSLDGGRNPAPVNSSDFAIVATGVDINTVQIEATNNTTSPLRLCIGPGTLFQPDLAWAQLMACIRGFILDIPPLSSSQAAVELKPASAVFAPIQVSCLEMNKRAPTPGVKFKILPNPDPGQVALARMAARSPIKGPWDQARMWIYTDKATYPQIREKLIPAPSEGQYARGVYEVWKAAHVDFTEEPYRGCLDASLLFGGTPQAEATRWWVRVADPSSIAAIGASPTRTREFLSRPRASDQDVRNVFELADAMAGLSDRGAQTASVRLLLEGVPAERRKSLAIGIWPGRVASLATRLISSEAEEVALAGLELAAQLKPPRAKFVIASLAVRGKDRVKQRAAEVLSTYP